MTTATRHVPVLGSGDLGMSWDTAMPAVWLLVRIVLGVEWVRAGWEKIGDAGWTKAPVGGAVEGFLNGAIAKSTQGEHPEVQHWFHDLAKDIFLPNADVLAYLVAYGELLVGLALILGLFTQLSVLFGVLMNFAFLLAGTSSTNPQMLLLGLALAAFGSTAGTYGVDRWVLPWFAARFSPKVRLAVRNAFVAGLLVLGALLAWIATNEATWLIAVVVAALVFLVTSPGRLNREADQP